MKSILITNDDGIEADGLYRLVKAAKSFGEIWVVAPEGQRSAASHSITLHAPIDVFPYDFPVEGVKAFSCSGMPGDCVRVGSLSVMPGKPDAVLSGINRGYNMASDIQYSATCGAAFEGAFQGFPSIALSEGMGSCHETTDAFLKEILEQLLFQPLRGGRIWNVNFPECPLSQCKGVLYDRTVSAGMFYRDHYVEEERLPGGGIRYRVEGELSTECEEGTDFRALLDHFVSVGVVDNVGFPSGP